jgi:hypothetical protein
MDSFYRLSHKFTDAVLLRSQAVSDRRIPMILQGHRPWESLDKTEIHRYRWTLWLKNRYFPCNLFLLQIKKA